jgi:hypothetical protein
MLGSKNYENYRLIMMMKIDFFNNICSPLDY